MPYVDQDTKDELETRNPATPGELTYVIQQDLERYIETRGLSYATLAEAMGALAGAHADLVRRVLTPYEERKQRENGDAWASPTIRGAT